MGPHRALQGYDGALVFRRGEACVVSVPETVPEIERAKLRAAAPEQVFDPKFLAKVFVVSTDRVTGPAWIGIADRSDFKPARGGARLLGAADKAAVLRLAEGCGEMAWKQSKLVADREPLFGLTEGSEIVAAAGYLVMGGLVAYIGVITHPGHRGKGHSRAAGAAAMEFAFERGLVALWRTPEANAPALAIGKSLGFQPYARSYDVQLLEDEF